MEVQGGPIICSECHCESCRKAAEKMESFPHQPIFREKNGGTPFVLYRKDRVSFLEGTESLKSFRLSPKSGSRRAYASCCDSPVFLEFQHGHWLSLYASLWPKDSRPKMDLRTMTSDLPDPSILDNDLPNFKKQSLPFMWRLLKSWAAMGFKDPKIECVKE